MFTIYEVQTQSRRTLVSRVAKLILFLFVIVIQSQQLHATIWRVNNNGDTTADFLELSEATASQNVASGDTIHLEGSPTRYNTAVISKRLVILGPGYFLAENPDTQHLTLESTVSVDMRSGAEGTVLDGITLRIRSSTISLSVDNMVIQHCRLSGETVLGGEHIIFAGNYVEAKLRTENNNIIRNNYILGGIDDGGSNCTIENNVFGTESNRQTNGSLFYVGADHSIIRNNIFTGEDASISIIIGDGNVIEHNLTTLDQLETIDGNLNNVDLSSVFVGPNGNSTDGQWQLAENSPAIEAGANNSDMGMFGGNSPYRLSGIPMIPRIIELDVPTQTSQEAGLTVRIKAASN